MPPGGNAIVYVASVGPFGHLGVRSGLGDSTVLGLTFPLQKGNYGYINDRSSRCILT